MTDRMPFSPFSFRNMWVLLLPLMLLGSPLATQAGQRGADTQVTAAGEPAETDPDRRANWSLGLGIGSLLGAGGTIVLALACFGSCALWMLLLPSMLFFGAGLAAVLLGVSALQLFRRADRKRGRWKAILGLGLGAPAAIYGIIAIISLFR